MTEPPKPSHKLARKYDPYPETSVVNLAQVENWQNVTSEQWIELRDRALALGGSIESNDFGSVFVYLGKKISKELEAPRLVGTKNNHSKPAIYRMDLARFP